MSKLTFDKPKSHLESYYWQVVRGICIICVVAIHARAGIGENYSFLERCYYLIVRNIVNFPVPVFFFIAGYFSYSSLTRYEDDLGGYLSNRLIRLGVPYLIWSFVYLLPGVIGGGINLRIIFISFALGKSATPFYYIVVLMYYTMFTPLLYKIVTSRYKSIPFFATVLLFLVLYLIQINGMNVWDYVHYTPVWLPFYFTGLYLRIYKPKIRFSLSSILLVIGLSFVLEILENIWLSECLGYTNMAYGMIRIGGYLYAAGICIFIYKVATESAMNVKHGSNRLLHGLKKIGDISYGIFYLHCLFIMIIARVFSRVGFTNFFGWRIVEICGAITFSCLFIYMVKHVVGDRFCRLFLGF